jgi:hypothetical protein
MMPLTIRLLSLTFSLLIIGVFLPVTAVVAQSEQPVVFCGELAASDCELLRTSKQSMLALRSLETDAEVIYEITDIPPLVVDGKPLAITDAGVSVYYQSRFSFTPEAQRRLEILGQINENLAMMAILASPTGMWRLIDGINGEFKVTLEFSGDALRWLETQSDQFFPQEVNFTFRLVDTVLYLDLREIEAWAGKAPLAEDADWIAFDLVALDDQLRAQNEPGVPFTLAFLISTLAQVRTGAPLAEFYRDIQLLGELDRNLAPGEMVTIARATDRQVRGQAYAVYVTTVDAQAILLWSTRLLNGFLLQSSGEIDPALSLALLSAPGLAQGMEYQTTELLDPDSGLVFSRDTDFRWDMTMLTNLLGLAETMGDSPVELVGPADGGPYLTITSAVDFLNHDQATPVDAPANVLVAPLEELFSE